MFNQLTLSSFKTQWFGKTFFLAFIFLILCFLLSIFVFGHPLAEGLALIILGLLVLVLTIWRLELGVLAAFLELFANSHGHLISFSFSNFSLSLRMVIFLAVIFGWLGTVLVGRATVRFKDTRFFLFLPLIIAILIGLIVGFSQNEITKAFNDSNAYFYLVYLLPIFSVDWDNLKQKKLLQILAAAACWVIVLSLGLLYVFTHFPAWMLSPTYTFIRDTRTGELTRMTETIFRIFLQAQFAIIVWLFLLAPWFFLKETGRRLRWCLLFIFSSGAAVLLISLSRSFWMGMIVGATLFIFLVIKQIRPVIKNIVTSSGLFLTSGIIGVFILVLIILFPLPYRVGSADELSGLFSSRTSETSDVAVSSRWNLLPEMWKEIKNHPLIGNGFGEEVTFKTDDPRARAISPDGTWTTYSFEWGWFDLWLKMGILGPLAFLWLFFGLLQGLLMKNNRPSWLTIGLISSLVMLFATHVFSPYLNHPIGLGLLLFIVPFLEPGKRVFLVLPDKTKLFETKLETTIAAPITKQNV